MGCLIAVGGKGGVGKTTVAGLLVSRLIARGRKPVLAVDADPNLCLDAVLGVKVKSTIGSVREEARILASKGMGAGISKQDLLHMKIEESLVESDDFDLIAMGRSEGPGCYCYANNVLKTAIQELSKAYPYVVLDNEAGLENLSRRIVQKVDLMVMVADPSMRGLETVRRLHAMTSEMEVSYGKLAIIVNRVRQPGLSDAALKLKEETGADMLVGLSESDELMDIAERGASILSLPDGNHVATELDRMLDNIGGSLAAH